MLDIHLSRVLENQFLSSETINDQLFWLSIPFVEQAIEHVEMLIQSLLSRVRPEPLVVLTLVRERQEVSKGQNVVELIVGQVGKGAIAGEDNAKLNVRYAVAWETRFDSLELPLQQEELVLSYGNR